MRALALAAVVLAACSPALDWRELRPEDSAAVAMFPCRPSVHARQLPLAGAPVVLTLHACQAGELTWALAFADLGDPGRVGMALDELRRSAAANVGATQAHALPLAVPGATPWPGSGRQAMNGRRADGAPLQSQVAVFAKGTRVYQATVIGPELPPEALETFFGGLRTP